MRFLVLWVFSALQSHFVGNLDNLSKFGRFTGIAFFQLIDDLIGVTGDPKLTGKAVGNDIREGKKTYPILLALEHESDTNKREKILKVFEIQGNGPKL